MKSYLINLEEDRTRLDFQVGQFRRLGLDFERVEGRRDDRAEFSAFRWWCAVLRPVVKGEIGCALSHREIYRLMVERGEACAAVFEDDVRFSPQIGVALQLAYAACRRNPKLVVLLGDHRRLKKGEPLAAAGVPLDVVPEDRADCAEGYVLGIEAARALESEQRRVRIPADYWSYFRKKGWIDLQRVIPPVTQQATDDYASSLGRRYVVAEHGLIVRLWWKFRRFVGAFVDCVLDGGRRGW